MSCDMMKKGVLIIKMLHKKVVNKVLETCDNNGLR